MKKILLYISICLSLNAYAINSPMLPNEGTLCTECKYTVQSTSIEDDTTISPKTESKVTVYTSLDTDNKILIEFSELQIPEKKDENHVGIIKFKQTYYFDGNEWKFFEYTTEFEDGRKINNNKVVISKNTNSTHQEFDEYYNVKSFLIDGFYYFNKNTIADAISGKMKYPKVEIKETDSAISLKSTTTKDDISALLKIENNRPILSQYSHIYKTSNTITTKIDVKFSGNIKIENTDIIIPKQIERKYTNFLEKIGLKFKTSIISCKYLKDFNFDKKAPKITDKWKVHNISKAL